MNIYFLVEGKRTEMKVYPQWLEILVPNLKRINNFRDASENNYYIFSGNGFPALLDDHLLHCIEDINDVGNYDYFVICLDADEQSVEDSKQEILNFIKEKNIILNPKTNFEIIVQNRCFETWFLGNPKIYKTNPNSNFLLECVSFYNVKTHDPELMQKPKNHRYSVADFHFNYLKGLLEEKNIAYSKNFPRDVAKEHYLNELIKRNKKTGHIKSFRTFIDFCYQIGKQATFRKLP
jgi:hypothetical protein